MGVVIVEGERPVLGVNLGHPIVTNGDFATQLFKLLWAGLVWFLVLQGLHIALIFGSLGYHNVSVLLN